MKKNIKITPQQLKSLRKSVGITQQEAGELVYLSGRQWQKFEAKESTNSYVRISASTLELFCLKVGLPYPPRFAGESFKLSKTISFAGGPGGIGRTPYTTEIAALLMEQGYDVLIIADRASNLERTRDRAIANNEKAVKFLDVREIDWGDQQETIDYIVGPTHKEVISKFQNSMLPPEKAKKYTDLDNLIEGFRKLGRIGRYEEIARLYDFIFFDFGFHNDIYRLKPDAIITLVSPTNRPQNSTLNIADFMTNKDEQTKLIALMIGVPGIVWSFMKHELWRDGDIFPKEITEEITSYDYYYKESIAAIDATIATLTELKKYGVSVVDTYTTDCIDYYLTEYSDGSPRVRSSIALDPKLRNTLANFELASVKNRLLEILGVKQKPLT